MPGDASDAAKRAVFVVVRNVSDPHADSALEELEETPPTAYNIIFKDVKTTTTQKSNKKRIDFRWSVVNKEFNKFAEGESKELSDYLNSFFKKLYGNKEIFVVDCRKTSITGTTFQQSIISCNVKIPIIDESTGKTKLIDGIPQKVVYGMSVPSFIEKYNNIEFPNYLKDLSTTEKVMWELGNTLVTKRGLFGAEWGSDKAPRKMNQNNFFDESAWFKVMSADNAGAMLVSMDSTASKNIKRSAGGGYLSDLFKYAPDLLNGSVKINDVMVNGDLIPSEIGPRPYDEEEIETTTKVEISTHEFIKSNDGSVLGVVRPYSKQEQIKDGIREEEAKTRWLLVGSIKFNFDLDAMYMNEEQAEKFKKDFSELLNNNINKSFGVYKLGGQCIVILTPGRTARKKGSVQ